MTNSAKKRYSCFKLYTLSKFEKEERWLNEMSAKGMKLVKISGLPIRYTFEEGVPNEYIYRLEFFKYGLSHPESAVYISFLEDMGIEVFFTYYKWVYLRKKASDGPFDLYNDIDSKIEHYKRVIRIIYIPIICNIPNLLLFIFYHTILSGIVSLIAVIIMLLMILPLRNSIKRLKKEKLFRE